MIISIIVVLLTFVVPFWLRVLLMGLNMLIPDAVPLIDEVLQSYAVFNALPWVKGAKRVKTAKSLHKKAKRYLG